MKTIRYILAMLAVLSAFAMAATSSAAGAPSLPNLFDFNNALKPWTAGASDHGCLDKESLLLREEIGMIPGLPNSYAALTSNCGGRVWMMAAVEASGDTVEITFDARDLSGCEGCIPLVYAGRAQPKGVYQFTTNYQMLNAD